MLSRNEDRVVTMVGTLTGGDTARTEIDPMLMGVAMEVMVRNNHPLLLR